MAASATERSAVLNDASTPDALVAAAQALLLHVLRRRVEGRPLIDGTQALRDYLQASMAHASVETVRVIFLTVQLRLIRDEEMWRGSLNQAPLFPREIARRALELGAGAVIVAHNHPSGDPSPSRADNGITSDLKRALEPLHIKLIDHLIVAGGGIVSLDRGGSL